MLGGAVFKNEDNPEVPEEAAPSPPPPSVADIVAPGGVLPGYVKDPRQPQQRTVTMPEVDQLEADLMSQEKNKGNIGYAKQPLCRRRVGAEGRRHVRRAYKRQAWKDNRHK